jgi:imidazole glycerol-phosphate synthase subunit HisH
MNRQTEIVGILKYGSCNINSLVNALNIISVKYEISENIDNLKKYKKIILPGVGNMKVLTKTLIESLSLGISNYLKNGGIVYGICLGLQMLLDYSAESKVSTFGIIKGKTEPVEKLIGKNLNVNFNKLVFKKTKFENEIISKLYEGLSRDSEFYFLHSFFCQTEDENATVINSEIKKIEIPSLIIKNHNIIGSQFHPELSKEKGLKFLKNFSEI